MKKLIIVFIIALALSLTGLFWPDTPHQSIEPVKSGSGIVPGGKPLTEENIQPMPPQEDTTQPTDVTPPSDTTPSDTTQTDTSTTSADNPTDQRTSTSFGDVKPTETTFTTSDN